jgi:succinoglycan biosynthesis protein ExoA
MPLVSVIVPCYNEQATIRKLLEAIYSQTYPRAEVEVIIADGRSTDHTREEIEAFRREHPDLCVRIVDNPQRAIPSGLNRAMEAARGEYIVRLDAHSVPQSDYLERSLQALEDGLGENVGGVWDIRPGNSGWAGRSIAAAASHPLAVGDARYRYTNQAGLVETVPFGAYRADLIRRIGPYDETLLTNEDYEFNARIQKAGGHIWLDPRIRSVYYARSSFGDLARQYWRYGFWKLRMLRRYPATLRWRQALPPLFVLSLVVLAMLAILWPVARILLLIEVLAYGIILLLAGALAALKRRDAALFAGLPLAIAVMHLSWGSGFLWSAIRSKL